MAVPGDASITRNSREDGGGAARIKQQLGDRGSLRCARTIPDLPLDPVIERGGLGRRSSRQRGGEKGRRLEPPNPQAGGPFHVPKER